MAANVSHKNLKPAKRYSKALIELVSTNNQDAFSAENVKKLQDELNFVAKTVEENSELKNFIQNPVVSKSDKKEVLEKIFKDAVSKQLISFLFLLAENSRLDILSDIAVSFNEETDRLQNIVRAKVISAVELDETQKNALIEKLQNKIHTETGTAKVVPEYEINGAILGGIIIKINDTVIDLSIKKKIENLKYANSER